MIKDAIEDAASLDRTGSNTDHVLNGYRFLEKRKGGVMSEQEDGLQKDELTAAYLAGCYDTRKAYEQRLAEAEAKLTETEKELFILASDVFLCGWGVNAGLLDKAKRIYDGLRGSEGE